MRTYYQITSELYQEHIIPVLNAKQYDSGRGVRITLTDCGAVVVPEATEQLRLYCKKEDGTVSYLPGTLSESVIVVDFTNTLLAAAGMVECELQVGAGTDMVSTPVFRIRVLASNRDDSAVESTDEFTALETALATVQEYDTRIQTNTDDIAALDTRMDTAETDIDALEIVAAGLGAAATKGVANNLTTETAGTDVLDAAQGKVLGDRLTTAEGDITTLNNGLANLIIQRQFEFSISVSAGTIGTRGSQKITDVSVSGYTPILPRLRYHSDSTSAIVEPFFGKADEENLLYVNAYRATASAFSINVVVSVFYLKT